MAEAETTCSICGQEKVKLPEHTEIAHEPIYVCVEKVGKNKMPCDGYAYKNATRRI